MDVIIDSFGYDVSSGQHEFYSSTVHATDDGYIVRHGNYGMLALESFFEKSQIDDALNLFHQYENTYEQLKENKS